MSSPLFKIAGAIALGVISLAAVAGCKDGKGADDYPDAVRLINAVPESESLKVTVDDKALGDDIAYGDDSGFHGVDPGKYHVGITVMRPAALPIQSQSLPITVEPDRHYTAVAYGLVSSSAAPKVAMFSRSKRDGEDRQGKATVRVFNAAAGARSVDLLVNSIVAFKNVGYGDRTEPIPLAPLPYEWTVTPAGNDTQAYGPTQTVELKEGRSYLVVVMGSAATHDLIVKAFEE